VSSAGTTVVGEKLTVYVPCDVALVRARLGYQETLTPVELIVLRAVHAGAATLTDLCRELGFSRRIAVDLVHDLWQAKYLRLVRSYAGLEVSPEVGRLIRLGQVDRLPSAETVVESRKIMVDKLSGYLMPEQGLRSPRARNLAVPVENSAVRIQDAGTAALVEALERGLRAADFDGPGRPMRRVLGAYVEDGARATAGRSWLALDVRAAHDPDTDELIVTVVDDALPASFRDTASRQLTTLVAERPQDEFTRTLRGQARPGLLSPPSLRNLAARLEQLADRAAEITPGRRMSTHGELESLYGQAQNLMRDHVAQEVSAELVTGSAHGTTLAALLRQARSQIILSDPWLRVGGLESIASELRAAIQGDVRICVLWGIRYRETKDARAANFLYQLVLQSGARPFGELDGADPTAPEGPAAAESSPLAAVPPAGPWFLIPRDSARTHAKIAVVDNRAALVTSWNFLSKADAGQEIGIVVRSPGPAGGSRPLQDLLRWARSAVPEYTMSRLLLVEEQGFVVNEGPGSAGRVADAVQPVPAPAPPPGEGTEEDTLNAARQWASAWSDTAAWVRRWLEQRTLPTASVVVDAGHRQALWTALREASWRLAVTSDQLSGEVVDDRLLRALDAALGRGVEVRILYGRPHEKDLSDDDLATGAPSAAEQRLAGLAARHPGRFTVSRNGTHAKVLLWDDSAVVGSFNYLSHEGTYSARNAHRQRSEVSLQLSGGAFADDVARLLGLTVRPRPSVPPAPAPAADASGAVVQQLLNSVAGGADPADAVESHLAAHPAPWELLDRLGENGSRIVLRIAAALCLSRWPDAAPPERRLYWLRWLVGDLWTSRAYLEAAALRSVLADESTRPGISIAILAAARGTPRYATALLDAWSDPPAPARPGARGRADLADTESAERAAVVAAAVDLVLFHGDETAAEILRQERSRLADPGPTDIRELLEAWQRLVDAVLAYAGQSSGRPLPLNLIRTLATQGDGSLAATRLWGRIRTSLARTAQTQLANTHSQRTLHELLRSGNGEFGSLQEIAEREDRSALTAWVAQAPAAEGGFGRLIDQAGQRVDPSRAAMHSTHRRKLIRDLMLITRDARRLDRLPAPPAAGTAGSADDAALLAAARGCAAACADVLPVILNEEAASAPEGQFVQDVLAGLGELETWHRAEQSAADGA